MFEFQNEINDLENENKKLEADIKEMLKGFNTLTSNLRAGNKNVAGAISRDPVGGQKREKWLDGTSE